jgi:predicted enzyme related to lactoylglutathione lyase
MKDYAQKHFDLFKRDIEKLFPLKDKIMIKDLDNIFLPVKNLENAKKFYNETLGLNLKFDFPERGMSAFKIGDIEPAIILKDVNKFKTTTAAFWLEVEDVKTAYEQLKSKGVKFCSEPFEIKTGFAVEFEDLDGNKIGITDYSKQK